jgi:hypothetical protein
MSFVTFAGPSSVTLAALSLIGSLAATTHAAPIHAPPAFLGAAKESSAQLFVSRVPYLTTTYTSDSTEDARAILEHATAATESTPLLAARAGWRTDNRARDACLSGRCVFPVPACSYYILNQYIHLQPSHTARVPPSDPPSCSLPSTLYFTLPARFVRQPTNRHSGRHHCNRHNPRRRRVRISALPHA